MEITNLAAAIIFRSFRAYFALLEAVIRKLSPGYRRPAAVQRIMDAANGGSIDERILKIEIARENLRDALEAIDDLSVQANANKIALEEALRHLQSVEEKKKLAFADMETLRQVAGTDSESFRRVIGLPTPGDVWRERLFGFGSGVVASLIAAGIITLFSWFIF